MTIGIWQSWIGLDARLQTSNPSKPGIITSRSTMSGNSAATRVRACSPLDAVRTSKYSAVSFASNSLMLERMSSTTRTRAVMSSYPGPQPRKRRTVSRKLVTEMGLEM